MRRDALLLVAGRAAQALLTIAGFRVLTTLLPPGEVGNYYLVMAAASLFSMFLISPVGLYLNRKFFYWYDERTLIDHFLGFNIYAAGVSAAAFFAVFAAWRFFGVGSGMPGALFALLVSAYIFVLTWNQNYIPPLNALGHRMEFVALTLATAAFSLLLSALAAVFVAREGLAWMGGLIVATGAVTLYSSSVFRRKVPETLPKHLSFRKFVSKATFLSVNSFSLPLAGASLFMWAQSQSYRVLVERFNGSELLGFMAVGFSIATSVAGILESLVQQIFLPSFYRKISGGSAQVRREAFSSLVMATLPIYIGYLFFIFGSAEFLTVVLVDAKYRAVFTFARFGAFIEFFRMTTNILASAAHSEMRTRVLLKPYAAGGIMSAILVPLGAVSGDPELLIPSALVVCGLLTMVLMKVSVRPLIGFQLDLRALLKPALTGALLLVPGFFSARGVFGALCWVAVSGAYFAYFLYNFTRGAKDAIGRPLGPPALDENFARPEGET